MILNKRFEYKNKSYLNLNQNQRDFINKFNTEIKKFNNSVYEKLSCLICNQDNFEIISNTDRYGFYYPTGICKNCGNIQQAEYFNDELLKIFYSKYYNKIYFNFDNIEERFKSQYKLAINKYEFLYNHIRDLKKHKDDLKILEIGCGPGGILYFFKKMGFDVTGIDYDQDHLDFGKSKNLKLINKIDNDLDKKFDLVIISHVLEHIKNPINEIKKIKEKFVKQGTLLYVEVPSIHSIVSMYDSDILKYLHIAHCYHFSLNSFNNFCNLNGLKILKINSKIQSILSYDESKSDIILDFNQCKNEILKIENRYKTYGKLLILKRITRRFIGKILNLLGVKNFILNLFRRN
ncbi:class I SAM-dependent methyltransferase [Candidatus Pelagibacter sp.]|uniref:class I SAM-dependent methyltransferase n=1 Tax=Candidatus Pelagibacter sp. TaxID=2024849 RepID=UPI003F86508E